MKKVKKVSANALREFILKEGAKAGFGKMKDVESVKPEKEVDADEFADTLEKDVDHLKALKIEESKLQRKLNKIQAAKARVLKKIAG